MPTPRKALGDKGERLAAAFLIAHGYDIVATNMHIAGGEIDILAQSTNDTLIVAEVKTRMQSTFVRPQANITPAKVRTLRRLAHAVADQNPHTNVQIDILEVDCASGTITHIPNI